MSLTASLKRREPGAVLSQGWSLALIIPAVIIGYFAFKWSFHEMRRMLHYTWMLAICGYGYFWIGYYWFSRSFLDGVTIREFVRCLFWPYGMTRLVLSVRKDGVTHAGGVYVSDASHHNKFLDAHILRGTWWAVIWGLLVSGAALGGFGILGFICFLHMGFAAVGFVIAFWVACDAVYYVFGRAWKGGLTKGELFGAIFGGPVAVLTRVWHAAKWSHGKVKNKGNKAQLNGVAV